MSNTVSSNSRQSSRKIPSRPKLILPVRGQFGDYAQTPVGYVATPYGHSPILMTPVPGQTSAIYDKKAGGFMFTQFRGIKDFTKTGLSLGEKSAFWLYEKVYHLYAESRNYHYITTHTHTHTHTHTQFTNNNKFKKQKRNHGQSFG